LPALCDLTDEAIPSTMCGFDERRSLWIIVKGVSQFPNGDFEDGITYKSFRPDSCEKFHFGDELP